MNPPGRRRGCGGENVLEEGDVLQARLGPRGSQDVGGGELPDGAESGCKDRVPVVVHVVRRHQRECIRRRQRAGVRAPLRQLMLVFQRVRQLPGRIR